MTRPGKRVSLAFESASARSDRERSERRHRKVVVPCMRDHRAHWVVIQRHGNASAFNGYRWQESDYSLVECRAPGCSRGPWRTKAAYVEQLPDIPRHPPPMGLS